MDFWQDNMVSLMSGTIGKNDENAKNSQDVFSASTNMNDVQIQTM